MKSLVCVKQVPDTTEIRIDPETNTLIRAGVPSIVNTFDAYALEMAARLRDTLGGTITLLSMGPQQASEALRECLTVGGDKAYLVTDRAFGGSDTLATSYILSRAIAKLEREEGPFDVIFCGKQAIDGDTAQMGPELAEHLDRPQVTYAVDMEPDGDSVIVKRECDDGYYRIKMRMPCLITVTKPAYEPRMPTIKSKMAAKKARIHTIAAADLDIDLTHAGLKGSPTKVKKTFTPALKKSGIIIRKEADTAARELVRLLQSAKAI